MTQTEVITKIRVHIAKSYNGKQSDYAESLKVTSSMISAVLTGKKEPTKRMLNDIGVFRVKTIITSYENQD